MYAGEFIVFIAVRYKLLFSGLAYELLYSFQKKFDTPINIKCM